MGAIHGNATATIASGQTVGAVFYVGAKVPVALRVPAAITGANVSFQGSQDNFTFQEIYLGGAVYSVPVTASKDSVLNPAPFAAYPFLKLVSDAAEGADRSFVVLTREAGR